ncbi:MAG: hypothetical protein DMG82_27200 [Acidobacteria bacterium]|nr:MAG: hypothetical protein DMG82_27200 [Acidobacteriota bacterium]
MSFEGRAWRQLHGRLLVLVHRLARLFWILRLLFVRPARPGMSARLHHVRRLTVIATRGRSAFRRFTPRQATCKEELKRIIN